MTSRKRLPDRGEIQQLVTNFMKRFTEGGPVGFAWDKTKHTITA